MYDFNHHNVEFAIEQLKKEADKVRMQKLAKGEKKANGWFTNLFFRRRVQLLSERNEMESKVIGRLN